MKEITFLNKNAQRWKSFESILFTNRKTKPDNLADLYIQLTDDLSYSRTYYPSSKTTVYLNQLTNKTHQLIYKNQKIEGNRIVQFWKEELPLILLGIKKQILYSFLIFFISGAIGWLSTIYDIDFARVIMGDDYIDMTINNISKLDPMAVYKSHGQSDMFSFITPNNIKVSFLALIFGLFSAVGTAVILINNGIMLGSFMAFFYKYGLIGVFMQTVWLHGTLEIFGIVVAGATGIMLGNSFVFPGTYSRRRSFLIASGKSIRFVFGLIPLFIVAGFIESFITRLTGMALVIKLFIILGSLVFIVWYFFVYPTVVHRKQKSKVSFS
jgi:uncharacterized membrane protein SpoIIM required for sporulation